MINWVESKGIPLQNASLNSTLFIPIPIAEDLLYELELSSMGPCPLERMALSC